jgi:predicted GIY-YIG superfamily endonuclease
VARPHRYLFYDYFKQRYKFRLVIMDRKEERRKSFQRKKKFKKITRSSKAKTERKKTKENIDDILFLEQTF